MGIKVTAFKILNGYGPDIPLPSTSITILISKGLSTPDQVTAFQKKIEEIVLSPLELNSIKNTNKKNLSASDLTKLLLSTARQILSISGFPPLTPGMILGHSYQKTTGDRFELRNHEFNYDPPLFLLLAVSLVDIWNSLEDASKLTTASQKLKQNFSYIKSLAPKGVNTIKFLQAAFELGIPFKKISDNTYQFGWGVNARWLNSTVSDVTPAISTTISKDKYSCNKLLDQLGIPVPKCFIVRNVQEAIYIAEKIGYPVVLKPRNLDGGKGVYSELDNREKVINSYQKIIKVSKHILLEEFIQGKDYRLQVMGDQVYWVVERQGPRVLGDGKSAIQLLIDNFNKNRSHENLLNATKLPLINIDNDLLDELSNQSLSLNSVVPSGKIIRLRKANNVSGGGSLIPAMDRVHPDNIDLAIRIARILKLDLAGIDLLIPDISVPWYETKAAVCEVNAQPQLSGNHPTTVLKNLVKLQGRIPVVVFLGKKFNKSYFVHLASLFKADCKTLGIATPTYLCINGKDIFSNQFDLSKKIEILLSDPSIEFLIVAIDQVDNPPPTLPIDKVNFWVSDLPSIKKILHNKKSNSMKFFRHFSEKLLLLDEGDLKYAPSVAGFTIELLSEKNLPARLLDLNKAM